MEIFLIITVIMEMFAIFYLVYQHQELKKAVEFSQEVTQMQQTLIEDLQVHDKTSLKGKIIKMDRDGESIHAIAKAVNTHQKQVKMILSFEKFNKKTTKK